MPTLILSGNGSEARRLLRERRRRMWTALQLLVVSGVVRLADVESPHPAICGPAADSSNEATDIITA